MSSTISLFFFYVIVLISMSLLIDDAETVALRKKVAELKQAGSEETTWTIEPQPLPPVTKRALEVSREAADRAQREDPRIVGNLLP